MPQVNLTGILGGVKAWYIIASTMVRVREALQDEFPGAGDDAALTVPQDLSVGCRAPVHDHFSPAWEHGSQYLQIDASWPGSGLLADRAYASLARLP